MCVSYECNLNPFYELQNSTQKYVTQSTKSIVRISLLVNLARDYARWFSVFIVSS